MTNFSTSFVVRDEHCGPHSIGLIDETSDIKKGDKTPGVQRQWCGSQGKKENCLVTVHLGYAREGFHCLIDGELYLPESWSADRPRCREAGIPDDMVYRPKWKIALVGAKGDIPISQRRLGSLGGFRSYCFLLIPPKLRPEIGMSPLAAFLFSCLQLS